MDAVKFLEERNRMCKSFAPDCEGCRVDKAKPVVDECFRWILDNPERAVQIVEEWYAAHPRKTRQSVFLKQWPNARIDENGVVAIMPCRMNAKEFRTEDGVCNRHGKHCDDCCREFWMQEVE